MAHIKISRGLDIPIKGKPTAAEPLALPVAQMIGLDLTPFEDLKLRLLVKQGDVVKLGQPVIEDKAVPGRFFVSPAGGVIKEVRRGAKRVLTTLVIEVAKNEESITFPPLSPLTATREQLIERFKEGGGFALIRSRPFSVLADPEKMPRAIIVKAIESAPFVPPSEMQVQGHEKEFQAGLTALSKLTEGAVHLVYSKNSAFKPFLEAQNVQKSTAEGPHPIGNFSVLIQALARITSPTDNLWTLQAQDVVALGHLLLTGKPFVERIISIAGPAVLPDRIGYFKARIGYPIEGLVAGRIQKGITRLVSGDPLMGHKVTVEDFLGFYDTVFCVFTENTEREFLHFFRLGLDKFTASKAYMTGHLKRGEREYDFTTSQHGEHRAFIDSSPYDKVQPLDISTMLLVKAVMAEDYDLAETYGLYEVDSEDFALPTFVCPSKIEMTEIIKKGLKQYAKEVLQ